MKQIIKNCIPTTFINVMMGRFLLFCMRSRGKRLVRPDTSALIAAPGGGNIGDQAMLESFLHNVADKKLIITTNQNALSIPPLYSLDVEVITMPGLIYGQPHAFVRDFVRFLRLLPRLKSLSVIGADVMDGGYNPHASAMRAYAGIFAMKAGVPSRILGFSWNNRPHRKAVAALRLADKTGVSLLVRDAVSHQRLNELGMRNTALTADLVFANPNQQDQGIDDVLGYCRDKPVALVNASGLIAKEIDQIEEYKAIINKLHEKQYAVVLLPHVIRDGANDLDVCEAIAASDPDIYFVNRLLEPDQVKRLAQAAQLVVTGRMHLSIMSLNAGTPAIVLSTQGKVDGLMKFFSLPELSLEPEPGFGARVASLIDLVQNNHENYLAKLAQNIEQVRLLANKNFQQPS